MAQQRCVILNDLVVCGNLLFLTFKGILEYHAAAAANSVAPVSWLRLTLLNILGDSRSLHLPVGKMFTILAKWIVGSGSNYIFNTPNLFFFLRVF